MAKEKIVKFSTIIWQRSVKFVADFEIDESFIRFSYNTTEIRLDKAQFMDFMNTNKNTELINVISVYGAIPKKFVPSAIVGFSADRLQKYEKPKLISRSGNVGEAILGIDSDPLNSICLPIDVLKQKLDYFDKINKR